MDIQTKRALATLKGYSYHKQEYEGLPESMFGTKVRGNCMFCGFKELFLSGTSEDPEEIFGDAVRCKICGRISSRDYEENV